YYRWASNNKEKKDDVEYDLDVKDNVSRFLRGESFDNHASVVRSASRVASRPSVGDFTFGFRVARTHPPAYSPPRSGEGSRRGGGFSGTAVPSLPHGGVGRPHVIRPGTRRRWPAGRLPGRSGRPRPAPARGRPAPAGRRGEGPDREVMPHGPTVTALCP